MITSKRKLNQYCREISALDPVMNQLLERYGYCAITPWKNDPFTQLISSIVSQQLSVAVANTIFSRVTTACSVNEQICPNKLFSLSPIELRSCGLSKAKTDYVIGISEAVINHRLDFEKLKKLESEQVISELIKLKGVGTWTAEMFSMYSLGHTDIFAVDDLGIKKGIQKLLKLSQLPDKETMLKRAKIWQPYRTIASWYLWRIAEDKSYRV